MSATFRHEGVMVDYTPGSAVSAGDVVVQGDMIGVATAAIAANALGQLRVSGVFAFSKSAGSTTALTVGAILYWDAGNEVVTSTASTHKQIGPCVKAASVDDTTVRVLLVPAQ